MLNLWSQCSPRWVVGQELGDLARMVIGKSFDDGRFTVVGRCSLPLHPASIEVRTNSTGSVNLKALHSLLHLIMIPDILEAVDVDKAKQTWEATKMVAKRNSMKRWNGEYLPIGTWRCDPSTGEFEVLYPIPVCDMVNGEHENGCKSRDDYKQYLAWAQEGYRPPPITVVRHVRGHLVSCNRRRYLAAKEAGVTHILSWFSETDVNYSSKSYNPVFGGIQQWAYRPISPVWKDQFAMRMEKICRPVKGVSREN